MLRLTSNAGIVRALVTVRLDRNCLYRLDRCDMVTRIEYRDL